MSIVCNKCSVVRSGTGSIKGTCAKCLENLSVSCNNLATSTKGDTMKKFITTLPDDLHMKLKIKAAIKQKPMNDLILAALEAYLKDK